MNLMHFPFATQIPQNNIKIEPFNEICEMEMLFSQQLLQSGLHLIALLSVLLTWVDSMVLVRCDGPLCPNPKQKHHNRTSRTERIINKFSVDNRPGVGSAQHMGNRVSAAFERFWNILRFKKFEIVSRYLHFHVDSGMEFTQAKHKIYILMHFIHSPNLEKILWNA